MRAERESLSAYLRGDLEAVERELDTLQHGIDTIRRRLGRMRLVADDVQNLEDGAPDAIEAVG